MSFYEIDETLFFDDCIMVLLDFIVPRDLKIHGKSMKKSTLKKYIKKSLLNRRLERFFAKSCEIYTKSDPQMVSKIDEKS